MHSASVCLSNNGNWRYTIRILSDTRWRVCKSVSTKSVRNSFSIGLLDTKSMKHTV